MISAREFQEEIRRSTEDLKQEYVQKLEKSGNYLKEAISEDLVKQIAQESK